MMEKTAVLLAVKAVMTASKVAGTGSAVTTVKVVAKDAVHSKVEETAISRIAATARHNVRTLLRHKACA